MFKLISKVLALALSGLATFTLMPTADYSKHVTAPSQMLQKSWQRTAEMLNRTFENERRKFN